MSRKSGMSWLRSTVNPSRSASLWNASYAPVSQSISVPVPEGRPASTVEEAVEAADDLGYPVVIKAQVLIGGRGKAGGIKLAHDRAEADAHARAILGMDIRGFTVHE